MREAGSSTSSSVDESTLGSRVGERCASPDRLPLAGRVPDNAAFRARFAGLRDNARRAIPLPGCYLPGLALSIAHGSRGLCSAPLCAALVAAPGTAIDDLQWHLHTAAHETRWAACATPGANAGS